MSVMIINNQLNVTLAMQREIRTYVAINKYKGMEEPVFGNLRVHGKTGIIR